MQKYADTAWRGEMPFSCEFAIQPPHEDRLPVPGRAWRVFKTLALLFLIVALIACIILFGMAAFGSGLRPSVMISDPLFPALYGLIAVVAMLLLVFRTDERKQRQLKADGFQRRASHRLKSEGGFLNILDFECRPGTLSALLWFRSGDVRPSKWRKYLSEYSNFNGLKWNEEELAYLTPSAFKDHMLMWKFLCWPVVLLGWPIIIVHLLNQDVSEVSIFGYVVFFLLCGGVVIHPFLFKKPYQNHSGPKKVSMNRRTGMVALYEDGEEVFCHPFIDFNCYFKEEFFGGNTGWVRSLHMAYRNEDLPYDHVVDLGFFAGYTSQVAFLEVWEIVKCYMNVTLPLPESLFLASRRPFDPTTASYDADREASPLVTENMSDDEFQRLLST